MPLTLELGWDVHKLLTEPYEPGPADPPCPPVFSGRQESLVMRAQAPVRLPGLKSRLPLAGRAWAAPSPLPSAPLLKSEESKSQVGMVGSSLRSRI